MLRLLGGILFGVTLELATIRQLEAYEYGQFLIMILEVPLCIGVAWGCILYSVMEFSDASSLPYRARPILDGLLALNIDLALDAIAIRLGFWDWGQGLDFQYFGVPYANFWAWFWVILFFSLGYRLIARRSDWNSTWLAPILGLIIGLLGVLGTNALIAYRIPVAYHGLTVACLLMIALGALLVLRPAFYVRAVPALSFWVPAIMHIYILLTGLIAGHLLNPPFLLLAGLLMTMLAFYIHLPIIKKLLTHP